MKRELRISAIPRTLELRQNSDGTRSIAGDAVVYNQLSQDLGGWRERVLPGAFSKSLRNHEVQCLYDHNMANLLGRQSSGTLTVTDGPDALRFECKLPNTTVGNDVAELCRRGDLRGMSFGFIATDDSWNQENGEVIRTVTEGIIFEISAVGNPAYSQTTVSLRSCPANLRALIVRMETKLVDGVELGKDCFAYVGDPANPDTWKLPIKFPRLKMTKEHISDALARFNQTEGIPEDKKAEVYARIVGAAKAHGIAVSKESLRDDDPADDWTDPDPSSDDDDLTGTEQGPLNADDDDDDEEDSLRADRLRMNLYFENAMRANLPQ